MTMSVAATAPDKATMTGRAWVVTTLAIVAIVVGLNLLFVWKTDIFGLLRDARGRELRTSRHERKAKYFLNFHYVPENFDGLVIGASTSLNWRLPKITGYHFYNESLLGADGSEQRKFIDKALETGHFKVALVGISRGLTDRHDLQDGLGQADPHEALGSFYSYVLSVDRFLHPKSQYATDGSWQMTEVPELPPPGGHYMTTPLDHKALDDYRIMTQHLLDHGTRVVYVVSPHYGLDLDGSGPILADYDRTVLAQMPPAPVIDFNGPEYKYFWDNPVNYNDVDHLSPAGADLITTLINQHMHELLHDQ